MGGGGGKKSLGGYCCYFPQGTFVNREDLAIKKLWAQRGLP